MNSFRILLAFFFPLWVYAQTETAPKIIEIRNADALSAFRQDEENVIQLTGKVVLFHEGAYMYCDTAFLYEKANNMHAYGQIHIRQGDTLSLFGDVLHYDGNTKKAEISGNVRLRDPNVNMTTTRLQYDRVSGQVHYPDSADIRNGTDRIRSRQGWYSSNDQTFTFTENVSIQNPEYNLLSEKLIYETNTEISHFYGPTYIYSQGSVIYCENGWHDKKNDEARFSTNASVISGSRILTGDSLYYRRGVGYGQGIGNVKIQDTTEKITVTGNYAETWKDLNMYWVTDNAQLQQAFDTDTLFVHGDTLKAWEDSLSFRHIQCWNNVKFFKPDLQGACDSLIYTESDSLMRMYFSPVLWSDSSQMTARHIQIKMIRGTLYYFDLLEKSMLVSRDDSIRYNQMKGKNMRGFFTDNELRRLEIYENGQMVYFPREEDGSLIGANLLKCKNITLWIEGKQVSRISCRENPVGVLHPWEKVKREETMLDGFSWQHADRPFRPEEIFIHREKPARE